MPFQPLRLLLAWDSAGGLCEKVVPRLRGMLQERAFVVEELPLESSSSVALRDFDGLILGSPVLGAGLRRHGPTALVEGWLRAQEHLDEVKTALFTVYRVRSGHTLRNTRQLVHDLGGQVVITHAYSALRPRAEEHVLPAECMVRIR